MMTSFSLIWNNQGLASLKLQVTHKLFLGITISIDPVIKEKESIFKFAKFYLTREIIRSSRSKNINKPWPCKASPHYDFIRGQN